MGGLVLAGSITIGSALLLSDWLFADNIVAWFVSPSPSMQAGRIAILAGLIVLVLVRQHYQNLYTRLACALLSLPLAWIGVNVFLNDAQFVFDSLFILSASISFAIPAIQRSDEPAHVGSRLLEAILPGAAMAYYWRLRHPAERLIYRSDLGDASHRLHLASPVVQ